MNAMLRAVARVRGINLQSQRKAAPAAISMPVISTTGCSVTARAKSNRDDTTSNAALSASSKPATLDQAPKPDCTSSRSTGRAYREPGCDAGNCDWISDRVAKMS